LGIDCIPILVEEIHELKRPSSLCMPRVLRIINRFNLGGPTYNAALLTKYMTPDFETMLVAGAKQESEESSEFVCRELGIDYTILPEMRRELNFSDDRKAYRKIKEIIGDFKPDIVHSHAAKAGALGRMAAHSLKVPVIVHTFHGHVFHSYFNPVKTKIFLSIERYLAKRSSAIVAISEQQKYELAVLHKLCPEEKIKIIPLGFDLSRFSDNMKGKRELFRSRYGLEDDEIAVGIIGRLVPVKNHGLFLRAIKYLKENSVKKIRAFIIGDGEDLDKLRNMASALGIENSYKPGKEERPYLTFTSWEKNIDHALAGLDIVALTSLNEGTPVSLIEAQAAGKPIVSTKVGGIENVVVENETALLSAVSNETIFNKNLLELVENENLRQKMGDKGLTHVRDKFHYSWLVNDMKSLYFDLLGKSQSKT
jgi:glycosyltransferase involved in cell wall biosynthesis